MEHAERARLFAPFDALSGFRAALVRTEDTSVPRKILSEDQLEKLDIIFHRLSPGDTVRCTYYDGKRYSDITGAIDDVDAEKRMLNLNRISIPFDRIYEIRLI
jgi:hypothetical protein